MDAIGAQLGGHGDAVHAGQHTIEYYEVIISVRGVGVASVTVMDGVDGVAIQFQSAFNRAGNLDFIFNY